MITEITVTAAARASGRQNAPGSPRRIPFREEVPSNGCEVKGAEPRGAGRLGTPAGGGEKPAPDSRPQAGGGVAIGGPVLTILTMPRCTVGTAGPPEEPPLCAEEAMWRDGQTARKAAGRLGGVNVGGVGVGGRAPAARTGRTMGCGRWTGRTRRALTSAAAGLGAKKETRSPPPPHVLLAAQACQSAAALRPISAQSRPHLEPIGSLLAKPRPVVPKRVASSRKRCKS